MSHFNKSECNCCNINININSIHCNLHPVLPDWHTRTPLLQPPGILYEFQGVPSVDDPCAFDWLWVSIETRMTMQMQMQM